MNQSVQCPVCEGSGSLEEPYDLSNWEEVVDPLSGYEGYEMVNIHTGKIVLRSDLEKNKVSCFNCEGTGILEWEE